MSWFLIAMGAPFLWSVVNHIDKFLLSKYVKSGSVGSLVVFSSLIGLPIMLIAYAVEPAVMELSFSGIVTLVGTGLISALFVLFYIYAMNEDEASVVVPFFQTIPFFGIVLGFLFLDETLTMAQILSAVVIFAGAAILSFDIDAGFAFKKRLVGFVLIASFLFALQQVLFKVGAEGLTENFWVSIFWQHAGLFVAGVVFIAFVGSYRREFVRLVRDNSASVFSLNIGSELLTIVGNSLVGYASLLAPVALVQTVELYQPSIVFIIGVLITFIAPNIAIEKIDRKHLVPKIAALAVVFIGGYLLYLSS